jgi:four helix bundle protein
MGLHEGEVRGQLEGGACRRSRRMNQQTGDRRPETGNRRPAMRKGADIANRILGFGAEALRLSGKLPRNAAGRHVGIQLVRSATSAGANYEEARGAESRADFVDKAGVAAKEMREACYWVALLERVRWMAIDMSGIVREANELAAILGASVRTARERVSGAEPK